MGKYKKILLPFLLLIIIFSCNSNRMKVPDYVVDEDKLVPLLVDIHLTDALLNKERKPQKEKYDKALMMYPSVLLKHNINRADFDSTIRFYSKYPEEFALIYDEVLRELSMREGDIQKTSGIEEEDQEEE
jgi:hypothetical protein